MAGTKFSGKYYKQVKGHGFKSSLYGVMKRENFKGAPTPSSDGSEDPPTREIKFPSDEDAMGMMVDVATYGEIDERLDQMKIGLERGAMSDEKFAQYYASLFQSGMPAKDIKAHFIGVKAIPYDREAEEKIFGLGDLLDGF